MTASAIAQILMVATLLLILSSRTYSMHTGYSTPAAL